MLILVNVAKKMHRLRWRNRKAEKRREENIRFAKAVRIANRGRKEIALTLTD